MRLRPALLALAVMLAAADAAVLAQTDDAPPGRAVGRSFGSLPSSLSLRVEPLDNSDLNLRLRGAFVAELTKRKVRVSERSGNLVLSFATETRAAGRGPEGPVFGRSPGGSTTETEIGASARAKREDESVANVWSTTQPSVLTGRRESLAGGTLPLHVVNVTIDDRSTGKRLWQGHASYRGSEDEGERIMAGLVAVLAERLGKNIREERFALP